MQRATSVNPRQTCNTAVIFANSVTTGRKSPGDEAESAGLRRQDPLLSSCKRLTQGQLAIATVMCAGGETTHQLNGAYSCTDVLQLSFRWPVDGALWLGRRGWEFGCKVICSCSTDSCLLRGCSVLALFCTMTAPATAAVGVLHVRSLVAGSFVAIATV